MKNRPPQPKVNSMTQTASPDKLAIDIRDLKFAYPNSNEDLLQIDSWQVKQGQRVFLFGESGSGKSTLLNLLSGTLPPSEGEVQILNQPFSRLSSRKRDKIRAKHIGVVFQQFNLIAYLSVLDNVRVAAHFAGSHGEDIIIRTKRLFEQLHLSELLLSKRADELSVGQQQRVAIARALINEPEILIVDEPTSALDANARDGFMSLLMECCDQTNNTLIFVSHDEQLGQYFDCHQSIGSLNLAGRQSS